MTTTTQPQTRAERLRVTAAALLAIADNPETEVHWWNHVGEQWSAATAKFDDSLIRYLRIARTPEEIEREKIVAENHRVVNEWNEGGRTWVIQCKSILNGGDWFDDGEPIPETAYRIYRRKPEPTPEELRRQANIGVGIQWEESNRKIKLQARIWDGACVSPVPSDWFVYTPFNSECFNTWRHEYRIAPEPKYRPWTQRDALFGKLIIGKTSKREALITAALDGRARIYFKTYGEGSATYAELLEFWQQPDGTPCGELEGEG